MENYSVLSNGNEFITEMSNAQINMLIEALDYAIVQSRTSCIHVFEAHETPFDGADEAESMSRQLRLALDSADCGTINITY